MDKTIVHLQEGEETLQCQGDWKALYGKKGGQAGERKRSCGEREGAVGTAQGLQQWAACLLGGLPFVQIRAGDTAKLFLSSLIVIQTDRAFLWLPYRMNFRCDARGYSI